MRTHARRLLSVAARHLLCCSLPLPFRARTRCTSVQGQEQHQNLLRHILSWGCFSGCVWAEPANWLPALRDGWRSSLNPSQCVWSLRELIVTATEQQELEFSPIWKCLNSNMPLLFGLVYLLTDLGLFGVHVNEVSSLLTFFCIDSTLSCPLNESRGLPDQDNVGCDAFLHQKNMRVGSKGSPRWKINPPEAVFSELPAVYNHFHSTLF